MKHANSTPPRLPGSGARAGRMPEKRRAILEAARTVFGQGGFSRTSIDLVTAEAQVSKRTVYNHFSDKEDLFLTVILENAADIAQLQAVMVERHLHKIVDLEQDLVDLALERVHSLDLLSSHWALVRIIEAESTHIPLDVLEAWRDAGPRATQRMLRDWFSGLGSRGFLATDDPDRTAELFNLLTFIAVAQPTFYGAIKISRDEIQRIVTSGVAAFLELHRPAR